MVDQILPDSAVPATLTELRYVAFPASFKDDQGRRVHQFIVLCQSGGVDNDALAEKIAEALSAIEGLRERAKFTENYESLRLVNSELLAACRLIDAYGRLPRNREGYADLAQEAFGAVRDAIAKAEAMS